MSKYKPHLVLGPGDSVREEMIHYGWEQKDLAEIMSMSEKHICDLLNNKVPLSFDVACKLSKIFKQSPQFWVNLDINYRLKLEDRSDTDDTAALALIYRYMPVREMRKKGWLTQTGNLINQVKKFWSVDKLQFDFLDNLKTIYFRKTYKKDTFNPYNALTWLQKAKNEVKKTEFVSEYNEEALYLLSDKIPEMTLDENGVNVFIDSLRDIGVGFLWLPHLEKTYTDGALFWHNNHPVIIYTARYNRKDNFWFTITHEIGHILLHDKSEKRDFIDSIDFMDKADIREREADDFARKHLKSDDILRFFKESKRISKKKVIMCAEFLGLHPGIVAGCLQYYNKLRYSSLNEFRDPVRSALENL